MRIHLQDRPIAITGAGSGIGRATALECAKAGMPVALNGRRVEKLEETAEEIKAAGGRAIVIQGDVTRIDDCEEVVAKTVESFGPIYAIYANAGYGIEQAMHLTADSELRSIFETNFFGCMATLRPALTHMLEQRSGHVLMCSSAIGKIGIPYYGAYCATKACQTIVGRAMKHELRPLGVHVTTVHPVLTKTEFAAVAQQHSGGRRMADDMPNLLVQTPQKVARATVKSLRKPKTEVWTSPMTRWAFALLIASPRLADFALSRAAKGKS